MLHCEYCQRDITCDITVLQNDGVTCACGAIHRVTCWKPVGREIIATTHAAVVISNSARAKVVIAGTVAGGIIVDGDIHLGDGY